MVLLFYYLYMQGLPAINRRGLEATKSSITKFAVFMTISVYLCIVVHRWLLKVRGGGHLKLDYDYNTVKQLVVNFISSQLARIFLISWSLCFEVPENIPA